MGRIVLAAVLAGLAVWVWGFVSHVVLPIGEMGIDVLPDEREAPLVRSLDEQVTEKGLYFIPGARPATNEEREAWFAEIRRGPWALLVIEPGGVEPMAPKQLVTQLVTNVLAMACAALLVSLVSGSYLRRAGIVVLMGLFAVFLVNLPAWNWYHYPAAFTAGQVIDVTVGSLVGGLVVAGLVPRPGR